MGFKSAARCSILILLSFGHLHSLVVASYHLSVCSWRRHSCRQHHSLCANHPSSINSVPNLASRNFVVSIFFPLNKHNTKIDRHNFNPCLIPLVCYNEMSLRIFIDIAMVHTSMINCDDRDFQSPPIQPKT